MFNTTAWTPKVLPGYFYIGMDEYYLYAQKKVIDATASGGSISLPAMEFKNSFVAPIVVTDVVLSGYSAATAEASPFAKTYEAPLGSARTPEKYRRRVDLTSLKDGATFTLESYEFAIDWGQPVDGSYSPTMQISPSNAHVIIEMEDPENTVPYYRPPDIDLNPLHSPVVAGKFLVVTDEEEVATKITVSIGTDITAETEGVYPVFARVTNAYGSPIYGVSVLFTPSTNGTGRGKWYGASSATVTATTRWDGTAVAYWQPLAVGSAYPRIGIRITASSGSISAFTYVHHGTYAS